MIRANTIQKYTLFLNELRVKANKGELYELHNSSRKAKVSSHLMSYLVSKGIFAQQPNGTYKCMFEETSFNEEGVRSIVEGINAMVKERGWGKKEPSNVHSALAKFTVKDLLEELKARGYTGTISVKKDISF